MAFFSKEKTIACRVPQESVLGTLLFLIAVSNVFFFTNLFSDDTSF